MLAAQAQAHADFKGFVCVGTEPFFSVDIDVNSGKLNYTAPEVLNGMDYKISKPMNAVGLNELTVVVFKGKGVNATVLSNDVGARCTDGMSDNEYSYHLVLTRGDIVNYGCCELKAQD
jgi:uncharacterized membrane protein